MKTVKEIIIMLLVCLVLMLVTAIALYKYIPNKKAVPEISIYTASSEIEECLNDNVTDKKSEVVLTYEVTSSDLNTYKNIKEYVPGNVNPFASIVEKTSEDNTGASNENGTNEQASSEETKNSNINSSSNITSSGSKAQNTGTK